MALLTRSDLYFLAKLFATFTGIEKALLRGDYEKKWFEQESKAESVHAFKRQRLRRNR